MSKAIKKVCKEAKHTRWLLSIILFVLVFVSLGIPYVKWGFKTDDFGNIYHSIFGSFRDVLRLFYEGKIEAFYTPSNVVDNDQGFFGGLYRPMSFIYYYLQYCIFGIKPYGFFLVTIMFHGINSVLLFTIFSLFVPLSIAFLGASFFAFHPSLWNWIGWVSAQTYYIELCVLLLLILALKKYLDTKELKYYIVSCLLFASNLFLKEASILLPVWVIGATYLYTKFMNRAVNPTSTIKSMTSHILSSITVSLGYWFVCFGYLFARLSIFPINNNTSVLTFEPTWASFIARQKARVLDFVTYVSDMIGLSWLPQNNQIIKGSLIMFICFALLWLFIKSNKKQSMLFFALSVGIFSWPALLMHYQPRYIYMAIPFFIMLILIGISSYQKNKHARTSKIVVPLACVLIACNIFFLTQKLKEREAVFGGVTHAFSKLLAQDDVKNRALCFVGLPGHWFAMGTAQAVWMFSGDNSYPVYQLGSKMCLSGKNSYLDHPVFDKNYVQATRIKNGVRLTSLDQEKIWFSGQKNKTQKNISQAITLEPKYLKHDPLFVTWDYGKGEFFIVKNRA